MASKAAAARVLAVDTYKRPLSHGQNQGDAQPIKGFGSEPCPGNTEENPNTGRDSRYFTRCGKEALSNNDLREN